MTNPILKSWAAEQMRKANEEVFGGKIPYVPRERCLAGGRSCLRARAAFQHHGFHRDAKEILIVHQTGPTDAAHLYECAHTTHPKPSWTGESVGHYEGGELVVDTIGFNERTFVDNYRTPHTDKMHVSSASSCSMEARRCRTRSWSRIRAPSTWRGQPCSVGSERTAGPLEEISCAENNEGFLQL